MTDKKITTAKTKAPVKRKKKIIQPWEMIDTSMFNRGPGQPPRFTEPKQMMDEAVGYFNWCEKNPLKEHKVMSVGGQIKKTDAKLGRPYTQAGMCLFMSMSVATYHNYKNTDGFLEVTTIIDQIIYDQKYSGASVGLFNANIIARDLGLADKVEVVDNDKLTPWGEIKTDKG